MAAHFGEMFCLVNPSNRPDLYTWEVYAPNPKDDVKGRAKTLEQAMQDCVIAAQGVKP